MCHTVSKYQKKTPHQGIDRRRMVPDHFMSLQEKREKYKRICNNRVKNNPRGSWHLLILSYTLWILPAMTHSLREEKEGSATSIYNTPPRNSSSHLQNLNRLRASRAIKTLSVEQPTPPELGVDLVEEKGHVRAPSKGITIKESISSSKGRKGTKDPVKSDGKRKTADLTSHGEPTAGRAPETRFGAREREENYFFKPVGDLKTRQDKWKAFGFDSSAIHGNDLWAGRNVWYRQLTHSVRDSGLINGPCLVRVPPPSTSVSIFETIPVPLRRYCQHALLRWLDFIQTDPPDHHLQWYHNNIRVRGTECDWVEDLKYLDLLGQHEDLQSAVPDSINVRPLKSTICFCSNETHGSPGRFMGISECVYYLMKFKVQPFGDRLKTYSVTFQSLVVKSLETCLALQLKLVGQPIPGYRIGLGLWVL
ncbi:uncharacterized protein LOC133480455 isoform X3 [Phyllopteryx taeniolatus]|nr:uncharacterized protein LOC133480455 isoform X3 [Phyllopteryx taeniolatus]XP_061634475.1 uncharacterized protein LOC133480455 isoform X3 [Phyllopteryx taeniolatus]XP_061634477.1 uncharacterized protein LOC133480455 isoform X3 [Phyllopteryx taeniolatus]XP_061634478.1 uncharacterized protein LOC133480455 isoform X3 [Phyllopteryx taeniolatus]XP_061634479.1 uncharacterized protein LOC133480455 isoform X3 [Phyllopteryx taeniolatus]XP_061634480.1 uncharacterized protein LOC133480455 isoform X3 [P